jgi:glycosyltransferase involved in cell wall biosynthesis
LPPEQISEAYRLADISIIPTIQSEGTSLSCLEAQASGNAVIATTVGGLTDLILHAYNGLLIEPTGVDLYQALVRLITDDALRLRLSLKATEVAQTFSLNRWRSRWTETLQTYCPIQHSRLRRLAPEGELPTARHNQDC